MYRVTLPGTHRRPLALLCSLALACAVAFCCFPTSSLAQSASGTIGGTVTDSAGAVIPGAHVVLENPATGTSTTTTANGAGFFNFAAVAPGTYKLTITANGFATWVANGITEHQGESHNIPDIKLPIAKANEVVQVTASQAAEILLDNGANTTTLNTTMVDTLSIQGRDAAELVKFMPAMSVSVRPRSTRAPRRPTAVPSASTRPAAPSPTAPCR